MKQRIIQIIILLCFYQVIGCDQPASTTGGWADLENILQKIVPPTFPDKVYDITSYGAVGDGKYDCTDALNQQKVF